MGTFLPIYHPPWMLLAVLQAVVRKVENHIYNLDPLRGNLYGSLHGSVRDIYMILHLFEDTHPAIMHHLSDPSLHCFSFKSV